MPRLPPLRKALAALLAFGCALLALRACAGSRVLFAQGVELVGADVTREVTPGSTAHLTVHLHVAHALSTDDQIFVHCESVTGGVDAVHINRDAWPPVRSTQWHDQEIVHTVDIPFDKGVKPGRFEIYAGLYDPKSGDRLPLVDPVIADNRALAAWVDVVAADADDSTRAITPRAMRFESTWAPWMSWLLPALIAAAIAAWAAMRDRRAAPPGRHDEGEKHAKGWLESLVLLAPAIPFYFGILAVLEFIKDDAYISYRYAHNLVTGNGLVFNRGEHVEGFTNFLWVLIMAPFEALGWDLFQVCEVIGTLMGIVTLVLVGRMTAWLGERERDAAYSYLWGAFWLACSSSFVLWAQAGLEQPLASLLPMAGAWVLWRARDAGAPAKRYLAAGLLMGAGCMTRPELHLLAIVVGMPLVVDAFRTPRRVTRAQLLYVAGILAVTVPCHTFRYLYYGSLIPNTFYVKTGTGAAVWHVGLGTLRDMFLFNHTGLLVVVAPLAFADGKRLVEKATMALIAVAFMAYYVRVGVDEMQWHRLCLPALPFLCVLAALGAQNLVAILGSAFSDEAVRERARRAGHVLGWIAVAAAGYASFRFTYDEMGGFNGHGDLAGTFHPDLGKFLVRHERPHALVAFQDMGSTPYHAPDIDFLDFFGLVDATVAHARHDMGLHTFIGGSAEAQTKYDAEMREYFFRRNPEWAILTIYTPRGQEDKLAKLFDQDPTGGSFGDAYRDNAMQFGLWDDPRFRARYVPVRTWPRSRAYYLALWRRKDLWDQKPREVVLDAPPPNLGGVQAKLAGNLELLGSETTKSAPERHEVFVTTWWKLPGPMPRDLYFFIHLVRVGGGGQTPADHVPGDWMYPADRWQPGEILEDRVLVQLPPFEVKPGEYRICIGAYRRSSGERLAVESGPNDGQNRILLGTLQVTPLHPLVQQLIPPTRLDVMRKYPDRIVDSHRWNP